MMIDALGTSAAVVALAEMGDKTQLLAILLAARFGKPGLVILGILAATLANHALAAVLGYHAAAWLSGPAFSIAVGVAFLGMAAWTLVPDGAPDASLRGRGVFLTTLVAFFLVEIGDKTQIATSLLAARFQDIVAVTIGTTFGMMLVNAPAVVFGEAVTRVVPLPIVRKVAAAVLALTGVWVVARAMV